MKKQVVFGIINNQELTLAQHNVIENETQERDQIEQGRANVTANTRHKIKEHFKKHWAAYLIWAIGLILRVLAAVLSRGYIHPDEQYQSIEVVYEKIFGFGIIPWEFNRGARSWVFPGIVYMLFRIALAFGATNIEEILLVVRLFFGLCSMITVVVSYFFGKKLFGKTAGLFATGFIAIWYDFILWSTRTMSDGFAMNFVFLATYLVYLIIENKQPQESAYRSENTIITANKERPREFIFGVLAGVCIGFSYMLKFTTVIIGFPLTFWLLYRKKWKVFLAFAAAAIAMLLVQGLIDLFTWGTFLHSTREFFEYNIIEGKNAAHGASPFYYYIILVAAQFSVYSLIFLLFLVLGLEKTSKTAFLLSGSLFFIALLSFVAHKEYRFVFPVIPLLVLLASKGLLKYPKFIKKTSIKSGVYSMMILLTIISSAVIGIAQKTFRPENPYCQSFLWVGEQPDCEMVIVADDSIFYCPGYAYLQKNITVLKTGYSFVKWNGIKYADLTFYFVIPLSRLEQNPNVVLDIEYLDLQSVRNFTSSNVNEGTVLVYKNIAVVP